MEYDLIITLATAVIGSITGVISLAWHIKNSRPKLIVNSLYFQKGSDGITKPRGYEHIGMSISFRNKGKLSTTVENIHIIIANNALEPRFFKPITINPGSSEVFKCWFDFNEKDYEKIIKNKKVEFQVFFPHTFGKFSKKGIGDLETTGFFHLVA